MELDKQQNLAVKDVANWYSQCDKERGEKEQLSKPFFYLAGYAGTGKTTLAKHFREGVSGKVLFACFTGKAALVMQRNGCYGASTIHSLIYTLDNDSGKQPEFILDQSSILRHAKLLIIDECSMVNTDMGEDLLSFGTPILVLGDPGQLPPVYGHGFFTKGEPDAMLTEVHRQALDNPIIRVATDIRKGKMLGMEDNEYINIYPTASKFSIDDIADHTQIIIGKNVTRTSLNNRIRKYLGLNKSEYPVALDRVICLKNNKAIGLLNGLIGTIQSCMEDGDRLILTFTSEDGKRYNDIQVHSACFTNPEALSDMSWRERREFEEFDFGYAITCHKSQGSQWESVCVVDDGMFSWDKENRRRWLYTATTRAEERLTIVRYV